MKCKLIPLPFPMLRFASSKKHPMKRLSPQRFHRSLRWAGVETLGWSERPSAWLRGRGLSAKQKGGVA